MNSLNHTNLTTYDVPQLTEFFRSIFHFELLDERNDKFTVLRNDDGFLLALMHDKKMSPEHGYPGYFHIGFLQETTEQVDDLHVAFTQRGYTAPIPTKLQRGGPPTYGFYCNAPGGVTVEVSTMNLN